MSSAPLDRYRAFLEQGTYDGQDWSGYARRPLSRADTLERAFSLFRAAGGRVVVELGTIRSYTHGGLPGCNSDDPAYWRPEEPECWDWGAGCFTRVAVECLMDLGVVLHTVDLVPAHLARCRRVTADLAPFIRYHCSDSRDFLRTFAGPIDLLYLDTGDMTPIEPTAQLQLEEARLVVERDLIPPGGLVLLDDVRNPTPAKFGDSSGLGKSKYSLPYLRAHGFAVEMDEYQVLLVRHP